MPNPQDALPLPPRPNLERYKKLAKSLARASESTDSATIVHWVKHWIDSLARLTGTAGSQKTIRDVATFAQHEVQGRITGAQFVLARAHGFANWPKFARHLEDLQTRASSSAQFERAADAVVEGDARTLAHLLRENPALARSRSLREHGATLLHYCSANGVEGYRQKSPPNAVEIAEMLLRAGADVNAGANVYGGGATTLGLVATSTPPAQAGVQIPLLRLLLDHGATIDYPSAAGRDTAVQGALNNGCPEAAAFLANNGASLTIQSAAGAGRLDVVRNFFDESGKTARGATRAEIERAFISACMYGRQDIVDFLLDRRVDPAAQDANGQTGLHAAAIGGHVGIIRLLLTRKPPLELRNVYGGTVLGQALWSAAHGGDAATYETIIQMLIESGAKLPARHVPVNERIDGFLRRYGSEPDPEFYWTGEEP